MYRTAPCLPARRAGSLGACASAALDDILQDDQPQLIGKSIIATDVVEEEAERLAAKPLRGFQWRSRRPAEDLEIATGTVQVDLAMGADEIDWVALDLPEPTPPRL